MPPARNSSHSRTTLIWGPQYVPHAPGMEGNVGCPWTAPQLGVLSVYCCPCQDQALPSLRVASEERPASVRRGGASEVLQHNIPILWWETEAQETTGTCRRSHRSRRPRWVRDTQSRTPATRLPVLSPNHRQDRETGPCRHGTGRVDDAAGAPVTKPCRRGHSDHNSFPPESRRLEAVGLVSDETLRLAGPSHCSVFTWPDLCAPTQWSGGALWVFV